MGVVNDLKFSQDGSLLIASIGQEHRLGRWSSMKNAKNAVAVIRLVQATAEPEQVTNGQHGPVSKKAKLTN